MKSIIVTDETGKIVHIYDGANHAEKRPLGKGISFQLIVVKVEGGNRTLVGEVLLKPGWGWKLLD